MNAAISMHIADDIMELNRSRGTERFDEVSRALVDKIDMLLESTLKGMKELSFEERCEARRELKQVRRSVLMLELADFLCEEEPESVEAARLFHRVTVPLARAM
jgi:hypothetical protein